MGKTKLKATDKQIAANRRNAAKSIGPATPAGKARAARNALKHGLLANEIIIDAGEGAESPDEFNAVLFYLCEQFDPRGPLEEMLVEKIAVAYWRLRRAHRYEVGVIRQKLDRATDEYYEPDPFAIQASRSPDVATDAKIVEAQDLRHEWQSDKQQCEKMRKAGKDLQEIYDWHVNWEMVYDKAVDIVDEQWADEISEESPAALCGSLRQAGWTDDDIWQCHLDVCAEQIESQTEAIAQLQKEKQADILGVQVRKKLGSIPAGHDLDQLLRYEGAIERQFYKAIDQLERLQRNRCGQPVPAPVNIDVTVTEPETR